MITDPFLVVARAQTMLDVAIPPGMITDERRQAGRTGNYVAIPPGMITDLGKAA